MTGAVERFARQAREVDMLVGTDARGVAHVIEGEGGWAERSCFPQHPPYPRCAPGVERATKLCVHCRELPGRERHAREVLGCDGPSWEAWT